MNVLPGFSRSRSVLAAALSLAILLAPQTGPAHAEPADQQVGDATPLRSWHFAEGNSRGDFRTYFSVLNLSDRPASVTANYLRDDGIRLTQWFGVERGARLAIGANEIVGPRAFSASFFSDEDVVVERSTLWGPDQNAETTIGYSPMGKRTWHFAGGTTRGLVSTYYVLQNLTDETATVTASFVPEDRPVVSRSFELAPRAREAYRVDDLLPDTAFGATFVADRDILVERTIEREGPIAVLGGTGWTPTGAEPGARSWAFAEGSTRRPYATYFVLFNPNPETAEVRLDFRREGGGRAEHTLWLAPFGRTAFDPSDVIPHADFGTVITADQPIVAERSYYSTSEGLFGTIGHTSLARPQNGRSWYFAEGNTYNRIETYFLLYNPSERPAEVAASYFPSAGEQYDQALTVEPGQRISLRANDIVPGRTFSSRFLSDEEIVVERIFYFPGWSGFTAVGAGQPLP